MVGQSPLGVGVSTDGGITWEETAYDTQMNNTNAIPYRIAVHPYNASVAVVTGYEGFPLVYTGDMGKTWANAILQDTDGSTHPLVSVGPYGNSGGPHLS